ncbi:MAG TPA: hypothetical protein PK765_06675 [bacterium]|nr:hypothetical protein [bacterium]
MNRENLVADLRRIDAEHEYLGIGTVLSNIQTFDDSEVEGFHAFFSRVVSVLESYSESQRRAFLGELAKIYQRDAFALRRAM